MNTTALTFNIRYDNPSDGQDAWPNRSEWVASLIDSSSASVVGLQEVLHHQLLDITSHATRFAWVGVGRDDGLEEGEFSPILYDSTAWGLISWQTRWLSPDSSAVGVAGWDAALPRIATIADLEFKSNGTLVRVINTHFDHRGEEARLRSAALIKRWAHETDGPVLVLGDFNFTDSDAPYAQIAGNETQGALLDTATPFGATGVATFRTFDASNTEGPRIDYVFTGPNVTPLSYDVLAPTRNGRFPSDHLPVRVQVVF
jgi:endonuclease/exonuclease/phosphatase family metal-dependent hydrolase